MAVIDFFRAKERAAHREPPYRPHPLRTARGRNSPRLALRAAAAQELSDVNELIRAEGSHGFFGWERSVDSILFLKLPRLRTEARYAYRTSPVMRRAVSRWRNGVVGAEGPKLKLEGGMDAVQAAWAMFSKAVNDRGDVSLAQFLRLAVNAILVDGEFVAHWVSTPGGMRLRIADAWRVDTWRNDATKETPADHRVVMGVEMAPSGVVTAYYLLPEPKDARTAIYMASIRGEAVRFPADEVVFCKNQEYPQQTRGIPLLSAMIGRADLMEEYSNTELERAGMESRKLGFLEKRDGTGLESDKSDKDGNPLFQTEDGYVIHELEQDQTFTAWDSGHPSATFSSFMESQRIEAAAASDALTTADITGDYSGFNFSSGRMGHLHSVESFNAMREMLELRILDPLFREWLKRASLTADVPPEAVPTWKWSRPPHIQPREHAQATLVSIQLGMKSISQAIREDGGDPMEVRSEIEDDKAFMESIGLPYPSLHGKAAAEKDEDREDDDGDKPKSADSADSE